MLQSHVLLDIIKSTCYPSHPPLTLSPLSALAGPGRSPFSLVLTDMPGFQNPARPATLQHLLMNYAAERLQAFFQHETFNKVLDLYDQVRAE